MVVEDSASKQMDNMPRKLSMIVLITAFLVLGNLASLEETGDGPTEEKKPEIGGSKVICQDRNMN